MFELCLSYILFIMADTNTDRTGPKTPPLGSTFPLAPELKSTPNAAGSAVVSEHLILDSRCAVRWMFPFPYDGLIIDIRVEWMILAHGSHEMSRTTADVRWTRCWRSSPMPVWILLNPFQTSRSRHCLTIASMLSSPSATTPPYRQTCLLCKSLY